MSSRNDDVRNHVRIEPERVSAVAGSKFPGHYPGEDHSWNLQKFVEELDVKLTSLSQSAISFDLVSIDASLANALRRTLIAEVPTVAIEDVFVWNNTSIIQDEVLSHRLGLVPLKIDPRNIVEKANKSEDATDENTIVFKLTVKCERNPTAKKGETNPDKLYRNNNVYASQLTWSPAGRQDEKEYFKPPFPSPQAVYGDILLAKLRPGQEIDMELHCVKGIGKDHAKFSPVATASYRLLPLINITEPIPQELIPKFVNCFSPGVIGVRKNDETGESEAYVKDARRDTVSREVMRHEGLKDKVVLARVRDHFIFNVESVGQYAPEELLPEAIQVLLKKIDSVEGCLRGMFEQ